MQTATVSAIAAIGRNRELGTKNQLSWRIKADLKRVKELTTGHPLIMGRKTYESIGHPLPDRTNIIVTHDPSYTAEGCVVMHSLEEALAHAHTIDTKEIFIFGGAQIYAEALPCIQKLYLTRIDAEDPHADVFFPPFEKDFAEAKRFGEEAQDGLHYEWVDFVRR